MPHKGHIQTSVLPMRGMDATQRPQTDKCLTDERDGCRTKATDKCLTDERDGGRRFGGGLRQQEQEDEKRQENVHACKQKHSEVFHVNVFVSEINVY